MGKIQYLSLSLSLCFHISLRFLWVFLNITGETYLIGYPIKALILYWYCTYIGINKFYINPLFTKNAFILINHKLSKFCSTLLLPWVVFVWLTSGGDSTEPSINPSFKLLNRRSFFFLQDCWRIAHTTRLLLNLHPPPFIYILYLH